MAIHPSIMADGSNNEESVEETILFYENIINGWKNHMKKWLFRLFKDNMK